MRFLRAIKEAQALGFTLAEIAEYLGSAGAGRRPRRCGADGCARSTRSTRAWPGLRRMRDELARVVGCACDWLDRCTCGASYLARRGREPDAQPALLHVTNGESAGNTLRQTGLGGAVLPWQDVLHEGPVRASLARSCCARGRVPVEVRLGKPAGDLPRSNGETAS